MALRSPIAPVLFELPIGYFRQNGMEFTARTMNGRFIIAAFTPPFPALTDPTQLLNSGNKLMSKWLYLHSYLLRKCGPEVSNNTCHFRTARQLLQTQWNGIHRPEWWMAGLSRQHFLRAFLHGPDVYTAAGATDLGMENQLGWNSSSDEWRFLRCLL